METPTESTTDNSSVNSTPEDASVPDLAREKVVREGGIMELIEFTEL